MLFFLPCSDSRKSCIMILLLSSWLLLLLLLLGRDSPHLSCCSDSRGCFPRGE